MKKRGISTIVATVLIVLITVAAVTILWAALSPLINQNLQTGTKCLDVQDAVKIDADKRYTCYNSSASSNPGIQFRVERSANTDGLAGFELKVTDNGNTIPNHGYLVNSEGNLPSANGAKRYQNTSDEMTQLTGNGDIVLSISPLALIEGEATACAASQEIKIQACA